MLSDEDCDDFYDELVEHCTCTNNGPRINISDIDNLDGNEMVSCYTSCPVNAVASMFTR